MASHSKAYALGRGIRPSYRLNFQHYLLTNELGYLLHPSIPTLTRDQRVADLGCGTAVWLGALAKDHPDTKFTGLDYDISQAPPQEALPSNMSVENLDVFKELPQHLIGAFDVVNIRFFYIVVKNNDPKQILDLCLKMLKPGGYLQWAEYNIGDMRFKCLGPNDTCDKVKQAFTYFEKPGSSLAHLNGKWVPSLPEHLRESGFEDVAVDNRGFDLQGQIQLTENFFISAHEILDHLSETMREDYTRVLEEGECNFLSSGKRCLVDVDMVVVSGRKAL